jgi:DNA (cytosine-5)-methyltransferase 1
MLSNSRPRAIDMFCGCGGISSGLRDAGFNILAGADIEPNYICTFQRNFPEAEAITDDLSSIEPLDLMNRLDIRPGELDLIAGGPPCQGFSKNVPRRQRYLDLPNNRLVSTFIKYVEAFQPMMVLMENVAEMKNGFEQAYSNEIVNRLEEDGYCVSHQILNAADYGVPQRRRRAFFIAWKRKMPLRFPAPTHHRSDNVTEKNPFLPGLDDHKRVTVWDAIGDLPSLSHENKRHIFDYECKPFSEFQRLMREGSNHVFNHTPRTLAPVQFERLASLQPGEGLKNLPDHLRPKSGYSGAYGRLTKDMVAPTITRWVFHPGSGRFGHPVDTRVITIREAARLQSFSDTFEFTGTYTQQAGQVGNAVPPLLVRQIALSMLNQAGPTPGKGLSSPEIKSINASMASRCVSPGSLKEMV